MKAVPSPDGIIVIKPCIFRSALGSRWGYCVGHIGVIVGGAACHYGIRESSRIDLRTL